ncbi:Phosphatase YqaB [Blastochloris viridis]|nr:Phosphatase YqaB [Blastochloris viridis]
MDGTLVDNMAAHTAAWGEWHARRGLPFDQPSFFDRTAGRTDLDILADLEPQRSRADLVALGEEKEAIYRELFLPQRRLTAGTAALLAEAGRRGLPMAVATAAPPPNIDFILDGLGIRRHFRAVVSPALGLPGKPAPDMFLEAAELMAVEPAACLVFEDAPLGVEAARRAGMRAVALTTTLPAAAFAGNPHVIETRPDFAGFDLAALTGPGLAA